MLDNLLKQLRDNPRLRWGVAAIVGLFWLYGILVMRDALQETSQQYRATGQSIARLRVQLAQPEWAKRVAPAKIMAAQLEGRLWQAPTSGLAQATFQEWLNSAMIKAGVTGQQITVTVIDEAVANPVPQTQAQPQSQDGGPATPPDLWKIKAKLGFNYNVPAMLQFMSQIENHEKQIVVDGLNVRQEPMSHAEMELYAYFQKQAAQVEPQIKK